MRGIGRQTWTMTLALAWSTATALGDDWPQWRGPNRDAVYRETGLLETFPKSGLPIRWRVAAGWGFASPVVAQGRVYLADSEVAKPNAKERLRCFDAATGAPHWTYSYDVSYPDWAFDPAQEIGPVATPIVQDGKVYALGRVGHAYCLDARSGDVIWKRDLGKDYGIAIGPGHPSPLVEGDVLILFVGGKPAASVIALDKHNGREVWRSLSEAATFSSPIVVELAGRRQLIVWTQESVASLNPGDGEVLWRQRLNTSGDYAVSTPVCADGKLLVGGLMFALDAKKPAATVLWPASRAPSRRIFSHTSTALVQGDYLYTAKSTGELICVDARTGKQAWEEKGVTDLKNGASIHLTANGDSALLFTDRGELIRARLSAEGYRELGRAALLAPTFEFGGRKVAWSPPAYANRHVFVRSGKELVCASLAAER